MKKVDVFGYQQQLLLREIDVIQDKIPVYDDLSFKIKGWAVTLWSAIAALAAKEQNPEIAGIGVLAILVFWFLDTYFKVYQRRSMVRMGAIEDFLNGRGEYKERGLKQAFEQRSFGDFPIHDPIGRLSKRQSKDFHEKYRMKTDFWKCFRLRNVSLIYSGLSVATLILIFKLGGCPIIGFQLFPLSLCAVHFFLCFPSYFLFPLFLLFVFFFSF